MFSINDLYGYKEYKYLFRLIEKIIKNLKLNDALFSITLIGDEKMQEINREYRNIDSTTDVLSFAFEENQRIKYNEVRVLGDIFISIPKMQSQAQDYNQTEEKELSFLVVHGILHLLGYDHLNEEDKKKMFDLQEALLNEKF